MRRSLIISGVAHAVVLGCGVIAFAARPNDAPVTASLPVEFISAKDYTDLSAGVRNAPKPIPDAKPLADKVGEPKPVEQLVPKVSDKPEVRTDTAPQAKPEPKAETTKAAEKAEKPKETKPKDQKPADQIAEELKKEDTKKPPKKQPDFKPDQIAEELKKDEAKTKPRPSPKFDADQVAALLDKRDPQRHVASAETVNNAAALGAPNGQAAQLSMSEMDALKRRLSECWNPPPGLDANSNVYVTLDTLFKPDGSLSKDPTVVEDTAAALGPALAESGKRALLACQPFTMLKPEHYDAWKHIILTFNPHELLGQ